MNLIGTSKFKFSFGGLDVFCIYLSYTMANKIKIKKKIQNPILIRLFYD